MKHVAVSGTSIAAFFLFAFPLNAVALLVLAHFSGGIHHHLWPRQPIPLLVRGVLMIIMVCFNFIGYQHNAYSQQVMLLQLGPIFAVILSVIWLQERPSKQLYWVISACIMGTWFIIDPRFNQGSIFLLFALGSALVNAVANIYIAANRSAATPIGFTFYAGTLLVLVGGFYWLWFDRSVPPWPEMVWLQASAMSATIGLACVAFGMQSAQGDVGRVSVMMYTQMPIAIVLGLVFFDELASPYALLGACIIVVAGASLPLRMSLRKLRRR